MNSEFIDFIVYEYVQPHEWVGCVEFGVSAARVDLDDVIRHLPDYVDAYTIRERYRAESYFVALWYDTGERTLATFMDMSTRNDFISSLESEFLQWCESGSELA